MMIINTQSQSSISPLEFSKNTINRVSEKAPIILDIVSISEKIFEALAITFPQHVLIDVAKYTKSAVFDILGVYAMYNYIKYLGHSFSNENIETHELKKSIRNAIAKYDKSPFGASDEGCAYRTRHIYQKVMETKHKSLEEVQESVNREIAEIYKESSKLAEIQKAVIVQEKRRSPLQFLSVACLTISTASKVAGSLKTWHILDVGQLILSIGNNPVFAFVAEVGGSTVFGIVGAAGILIGMVDNTYLVAVHLKKLINAQTEEEEKEAKHQVAKALLDLAKGSVSLASALAPILFAANPPLVLGLAIFAKTTGLIILLSKDKFFKQPILTVYIPERPKYPEMFEKILKNKKTTEKGEISSRRTYQRLNLGTLTLITS